MKPKAIILLLLCSAVTFTACKNKKQTLEDSEEKQEQVRLETLYSTEETLDTIIPNPGIKYPEMRKIDTQSPPVMVNIEQPAENKELDLNQYYTQVEFVKITHPLSEKGIAFLGNSSVNTTYEQGASFSSGINSQVFLTQDKLISGDNFFGYHCFDKQGNYIYTIVEKEELPEFDVKANTASYFWNQSTEMIALSVCDENCVITKRKFSAGDGTFSFHNINKQTNYLTRPISNNFPVLLSPETYAEYVYHPTYKNQTPLLIVFDIKGDTLSQFMNYNPLADIGRGNYTNPENSDFYRYGNRLTMRQAYNDTVYRVSADKLTPAFVLNPGSKKADVQTALKGDKKGKIFIEKLLETDDFLFVVHTEDYDSPNNRKSGAVKFFYSYYDKKAGKRYSIPSGVFPEVFALQNSNTDAIPLMLSNATVYNDKLYSSYTKRQLKETMESDAFASFPPVQQEKLQSFHNEMTDYELLIMILKK